MPLGHHILDPARLALAVTPVLVTPQAIGVDISVAAELAFSPAIAASRHPWPIPDALKVLTLMISADVLEDLPPQDVWHCLVAVALQQLQQLDWRRVQVAQEKQ